MATTNTYSLQVISSGVVRRYVVVDASQVPVGLRWDVTPRSQGQMVQVAYGDSARIASEHGPGSQYRRTTDASVGGGAPVFARLAEAE